MWNSRNLIGQFVDTINVVDFEMTAACQKHDGNCKKCDFYNSVTINSCTLGKRCDLLITYNTLCKLLYKECPSPKQFKEKDDDPRT